MRTSPSLLFIGVYIFLQSVSHFVSEAVEELGNLFDKSSNLPGLDYLEAFVLVDFVEAHDDE